MGTTVALEYCQLEECIVWLLEYKGWRGKAKDIKGSCFAALMCMIYLSGGRISEVLDLKVKQIADKDLHLHDHIQMLNLKRKKKKEVINIDDEEVIKLVKKILLNKGKPGRVVVKAEVFPDKPKAPKSQRIVRIDNNSSVAKVIEDWLVLNRVEQGHINPEGYVFVLGIGSRGVRVDRVSTWKKFFKVYKELGLDYVSRGCHGIRKTASLSQYEINKIEHDGDGSLALREVKSFLGHSDLSNTEHYVPLPEGDAEAVSSAHAGNLNLRNIITKRSKMEKQGT